MLIDLVFSQVGPFLGLALARLLPRQAAYRVGEMIVNVLAERRASALYQGIRSNQAVVRGWAYSDNRLHPVVRDVLLHSAHGLVDWFRSMAHPRSLDRLPCTIDEHIISEAFQSQGKGHGVIYVGAHLSSFNMFFMKLAQRKFPVQILSYHRERGSYRTDNLFRKRFGLEVTPISPGSLRQAYRRLKGGGFILTGVDRPDTGSEPFSFFKRATTLPIGHARLALKTGARIMIGAVQSSGPGRYHVKGSMLIHPERTGDEHFDARRLAQRVLDQLEQYISERPSEWMMFVPLWPELIPATLRS